MVQVSLKNVGRTVGLLTLVTLVATFLVLFTDIGPHGHAANTRRQPDPLDMADWLRFSQPDKLVSLDFIQKTELKDVFNDIVKAYSNEQVGVLRDWRENLPEKVKFLGTDVLIEIGRPFLDIIHDELHGKLNKILGKESIGEEFENVADFERHAETLITLALIYGDVQLRRRNYGGLFGSLEALMYYRLKSYRDGFRTEGRTELETSAERALAKWIDQIESENGYMKALLVKEIAWLRLHGERIMADSGKSWEEVSQNHIRGTIHMLTWAGYTPKWLGEFKNIPRHAAPRLPKE